MPTPRPVLVQPDSALTFDCSRPIVIPNAELTQEGVEALWSIDRQSLLICRSGKKAIQKFYYDRDAALMSK